jgi:TonB family protein
MGLALERFWWAGRTIWVCCALTLTALSTRARGQEQAVENPLRAAAPTPPAGVTRPVALNAPPPAYPAGAKGDAVVTLELTVNKGGEVVDAEVRSGEEPFAGAAIETVSSWRFEPALREGKPISARLRFELRFYEPSFEDDDPIVTAPFNGKPPVVAPRPERAPPVTEVIVHGAPFDAPNTAFSRAEVREMPGAFGDPFRIVELVPGVTPLATGIPYYFVRGAPPGNSGYFIDGVRVPLLYHLGLGPAVIHPGLVESVELYAGAAPVRYGRFAGGVLAAETAPPARDRPRAEANVRLFDAGALVEAPFSDGKGSALVAGRYSFAGPLLREFAPELELGYWDYQLRSSYALDDRSALSLFAFGSLDSFESEDGGFNAFGESQFHRIDLRVDHVVAEGTRLFAALTLGLDRTHSDFETPGVVTASSRQLGVRGELSHSFGGAGRLRLGADTLVDRLDAEVTADRFGENDEGDREPLVEGDDRQLNLSSKSGLTAGVWADAALTPYPGVKVTPGVRVDLYHVRPSQSFAGAPRQITLLGIDPRVTARFEISDRVSLENAFAIAHQPASFTLPVPGYELTDVRGGLQQALQSSAAAEWRPGREWTAKLTLFQNAFFDMTDTLTLGQYDDDQVPAVSFADRAFGHSYGVEVLLRRPLTRRLGGYLAYTLSRTERSVARFSGPAAFDHTHVVHAALASDLGAGFRFGARVTFYTGIPATRRPGSALGDTRTGATEIIQPVGKGMYPEPRRAPAFFRLDLRFEKRFRLSDSGAWLAIVAETLNTTLSRETLSYECDRFKCERDIYGPIAVPSLGLEVAL